MPSARRVAFSAQRRKSSIQCLAHENLHPSPSAVMTTSVAKTEKSCILRRERENLHPVLSVGKVASGAKHGGTKDREWLKACRPASHKEISAAKISIYSMNDTYVFCPFFCAYVGHDDDALVYLQKMLATC